MPVFILCLRHACYFLPGLHSDLTPLCLPHQRRGKTSPVKTPVQLSRRKRGSQSQPPIFRPPETGSLTQQEAARSLPTAVASWGRGGEQCTGRIQGRVEAGLGPGLRPGSNCSAHSHPYWFHLGRDGCREGSEGTGRSPCAGHMPPL